MIFRQKLADLHATAQGSLSLVSAFKLALLLPTFLFIGSAYAQTNISGNFGDFQDVTEFQISPDGAWVVFIADKDIDNNFELYSVPLAGGVPRHLNGPMAPGGNIDSFKISPDSTRVIYLADEDTVTQVELYSVPIGDGVSTKLNGVPALNGDVREFKVSADSTKVVYIADQEVDGQFEVFVANIAGGGRVKLNDVLFDSEDVHEISISPDSAYIVYTARSSGSVTNAFSVVITGGTVTQLGFSLGTSIKSITISSINNTVVFTARSGFQNRLYSVPITGGAAININGSGGGGVLNYKMSPDGHSVVYLADEITPGVVEIFSTPIGSQNAVRVNGSLTPRGDVGDFKFSPDSRFLVYVADQEQDEKHEVYRAILGSVVQPLKLSSGANGASIQLISTDSKQVIFGESKDTSYLKSRGVFGGATTKMDTTLNFKHFVHASDDGSIVAYVNFTKSKVMASEKNGQAGVAINAPTNSLNNIQGMQYAPGGQHIVYLSDELVDEKFELFAISAPFLNENPTADLCFPVAAGESYAVICL